MWITDAVCYLDGAFRAGVSLQLQNGVIAAVESGPRPMASEETLALGGDYLLPGFVDVHVHGFSGRDAMRGEQDVRAMSRALYRQGVAAFLPTTMSAPDGETLAALHGIAAVRNRPEGKGARVLGAHMEAPFLNAEKSGAQRAEYFCIPSMARYRALTGDAADAVRLITLAPELPGAEAFIREITRRGIIVSVGHTAATAEQTHCAAAWGASHATHTFNAQSPLQHRAPGVPGAVLTDERYYAELITDGVHLHPDTMRLIVRAKGAARAVAVTDAMEAAGMPEGAYTLGGQRVTVCNGEARLADGTLAGSVLTMRQALSNLIHRFNIPPQDAARMCTQTPAESIGERLAGRIAVGAPMPLTRWSRDWQWRGVVDEQA